MSSTPRPFFGRWALVWQAGVRLRQIVDHRGCSSAVAKMANGQSHGFTLPSASRMRLRSYLWVQIIKQTDHVSNYNQGKWLFNNDFVHSGNRRRGTPKNPAAATYVRWLPRESTTAKNPFPHDIPWTIAMLNMVTRSTNPHGNFYR